MYNLTLLTKENADFIQSVLQKNTSRSKEVSLSIARILANQIKLPLPDQAYDKDNINEYYRLNYQISIENTISIINEICIIDVETVKDYVIRFLKFRYDNAYSTQVVSISVPGEELETFFKIKQYFDKDIVECIKSNLNSIVGYSLGFNKVIENIKVSLQQGV